MTSFVITGNDKQKRLDYAKDFCAKQKISSFDISIIEKETTTKQNVQSIGIDEVKRIQKSVFLKPFNSEKKAVIIQDAHLLTTEAQNALLKVLEEPPNHTVILLGANTKESLLPTILSRCQLIELEHETKELTAKQKKAIDAFITTLPTMTIGQRLKEAESLAKDKDKAVAWIEKVIITMRESMLNNFTANVASDTPAAAAFDADTSGTPDTLRKLQSLHTLLKTTNVNPRFAIENTLLNL